MNDESPLMTWHVGVEPQDTEPWATNDLRSDVLRALRTYHRWANPKGTPPSEES